MRIAAGLDRVTRARKLGKRIVKVIPSNRELVRAQDVGHHRFDRQDSGGTRDTPIGVANNHSVAAQLRALDGTDRIRIAQGAGYVGVVAAPLIRHRLSHRADAQRDPAAQRDRLIGRPWTMTGMVTFTTGAPLRVSFHPVVPQ